MWDLKIIIWLFVIHKVTSQASELCPQDNIKLPDPSNCKGYLECTGGQPVKKQCPPLLYYNCILEDCTLKIFTPCCKNDPKPPTISSSFCLINGFKIPNFLTCDKYYECVNNDMKEIQCPLGQRYDWLLAKCVIATSGKCALPTTSTTTTTTIAPNRSSFCPQDDITFPDTSDCQSYYRCTNGQPRKLQCPWGTVWNCFTKSCTLQIFAPCCKNEPDANKNFSLPCVDIGLRVPNPFTCNKYFECDNHAIVEKECAAGQKYHWLKMKCVPASLCECAPGTTNNDSKSTNQTTTATTTAIALNRSSFCPQDDITFPDTSDCQSYYRCKNGQPQNLRCPWGTVWNCFTKSCTLQIFAPCCKNEPDTNKNFSLPCIDIGLRVPNPFTCNKYFECDNHFVVEKECAAGQKYHWLKMKCVPASICECAPGTTKNNTSNPITTPKKQTQSTVKQITSSKPSEEDKLPYTKPKNTNDYLETTMSPFCPQDGVTIPDGNNCRGYFICENGKLQKKTCPKGLVWNCILQTCSLKLFSPCCKKDPNPPNNTESSDCLIPGLKIPNIFTCNKYFECYNFNVTEKKCPCGQRYDWFEMKCVNATSGLCAPKKGNTPIYENHCPTHAIPDIYDCKSYFYCHHEKLTKYTCPPLKIWNCWSRLCTLNIGANRCCLSNNNNSLLDPCPMLGIKTPDPSNCHNYYECILFKKVQKSCPNNENFDAISLSCKSKNHTICIENINDDISTAPSEIIPRSQFCPQDGITLPNPGNCRGYFKCVNGQLKNETCSPFTVWNCFTKSCTFEIFAPCCKDDPNRNNVTSSKYCLLDGLSVPNPFTCDKYYSCVNHTIVEKVCPHGQRYDWILFKCVNASFGKCAVLPTSTISSNVTEKSTSEKTSVSTETPGSTDPLCPRDGLRYPTVDNCNAYLECQHGQVVRIPCPAGETYNCEKTACEYQEKPHCCASNPTPSP